MRNPTQLEDGFYLGQFDEQKHKQGRGIIIRNDGTKYCGYWHLGVPHGMGRMIYCSGGYYEGEFCEGKAHGRGKLSLPLPTGITYDGDFVEE